MKACIPYTPLSFIENILSTQPIVTLKLLSNNKLGLPDYGGKLISSTDRCQIYVDETSAIKISTMMTYESNFVAHCKNDTYILPECISELFILVMYSKLGCFATLKEFSADGTRLSLVMNRYECNLEDYLQKEKITKYQLRNIIFQVLCSCLAMSNNGVFHNDLHIKNIMIERSNMKTPYFECSIKGSKYYVPNSGILCKIIDLGFTTSTKSKPKIFPLDVHDKLYPYEWNLNVGTDRISYDFMTFLLHLKYIFKKIPDSESMIKYIRLLILEIVGPSDNPIRYRETNRPTKYSSNIDLHKILYSSGFLIYHKEQSPSVLIVTDSI